MKTTELKQLIKEAVKEAFQEEFKNILLEAVKNNKSTITESKIISGEDTRTLSFTTKNIPTNTRQAYMDILKETAEGPKSGLEGEFKLEGKIDPINGALPNGQLGLDQIMNLVKK